MKTISKILVIFFTLIIPLNFISCKKDYPANIPKWLKEKIRYYKKNTDRGCNFSTQYQIVIKECHDENNNIIYDFLHGEDWLSHHAYYDYDGTFLCSVNYWQTDTTGTCPKQIYFVRTIWTEPYGYYN